MHAGERRPVTGRALARFYATEVRTSLLASRKSDAAKAKNRLAGQTAHNESQKVI